MEALCTFFRYILNNDLSANASGDNSKKNGEQNKDMAGLPAASKRVTRSNSAFANSVDNAASHDDKGTGTNEANVTASTMTTGKGAAKSEADFKSCALVVFQSCCSLIANKSPFKSEGKLSKPTDFSTTANIIDWMDRLNLAYTPDDPKLSKRMKTEKNGTNATIGGGGGGGGGSSSSSTASGVGKDAELLVCNPVPLARVQLPLPSLPLPVLSRLFTC